MTNDYKPVPDPKREHFSQLEKRVKDSRYFQIVLAVSVLSVMFVDTSVCESVGIGSAVTILLAEAYMIFGYVASVKSKALILSLPVFAISVGFALHVQQSWLPQMLTIAVLFAIQTVLLTDESITRVFDGNTVSAVWQRIISTPIANLGLFFSSFDGAKALRNEKSRKLVSVLISLAAAIPVCAILIALFNEADEQFSEMLADTFSHVEFSPIRIFIDLILGFVLSIFIGSILIFNKVETDYTDNKRKIRISALSAVTYALAVDIVIVFFAVFQIRYLSSRAVSAVSATESAREGFFYLCAASAIIFISAALLTALTENNSGIPASVRICVLIMCLADGVVLASAVKRMLVYVGQLGLSVKRVLTLWLMALIAVSLVAVALKCLFIRTRALAIIGTAVTVFVSALSLTNIGKIVCDYNTEKYLSGELNSDIYYTYDVGYSSLPDLVKFYDSGKYDASATTEIENIIAYHTDCYDSRRTTQMTADDLRIEKCIERAREISADFNFETDL